MKCPRCSAAVTAEPDAAGFIVCPGCGTRLKRTPVASRVAAARERGAEAQPERAPNATATLPPGTPLKRIPRPEDVERSALHETLEALLTEMRALRRGQDELLGLLRGRPVSAAPPREDDFLGLTGEQVFADGPSAESRPPALRSRRRKTVLVIDDDEATREAAVQALEQAEISVQTAADGNAGLAAIAQEKPDVIVLELGMGGSMPGKDVINMIKATIEWLDIPIVLYTRLPVAGQKEARTTHGADELVLKSAPLAAKELVSHIVAVFRKA